MLASITKALKHSDNSGTQRSDATYQPLPTATSDHEPEGAVEIEMGILTEQYERAEGRNGDALAYTIGAVNTSTHCF